MGMLLLVLNYDPGSPVRGSVRLKAHPTADPGSTYRTTLLCAVLQDFVNLIQMNKDDLFHARLTST